MQAVASFYALAILAALVAAPTRARALLALALVTGAAATPWFLPRSWVFFRTAYGIAAFIAVAGVLDVVRRRRTWTATSRVLRVLFFADFQSATPTRRHLDIPLTIVTMLYQALGLTALWFVVVLAPGVHGAAHWLCRWGGGAVVCYVVPEAVRTGVIFSGRAIGIEPPELHRAPLLSTTLREFWGVRWNRPVGAWLRFHAFEPCAARGAPNLGVLAAFAVSAVLHAYFTAVALGLTLALVMLSFFVLQGVLVLAERLLRIPRRPLVLRRAWTVGSLVLTSPLFVEPMLQCLGI